MRSPALRNRPLTQHLRALRLEQGLSEHTIESYRARPHPVLRLSCREGIAPWRRRLAEDVRDFLASGEWRPASRARKAAAIRSFYRRRLIRGSRLVRSHASRSPAPAWSPTCRVRSRVEEVERLLAAPKATPARAARPSASRDHLRRRPAGLGGARSASAGPRPRGGLRAGPGQGRQGAGGALGPQGHGGIAAYNERGRPLLGSPGTLKAPELFLNAAAGACPGRAFTCSSSATPARPDCPTTCPPTPCATLSPPTCWRGGPTCARCRRCWATPTSRPPRSTRTCRPRICRGSTEAHPRARKADR